MGYSYLVLIPLIAGIGEVIRLAGVPCRYIPFINLIIGVVLGLVLCYSNSKVCLVDGLYIGLSASGLSRSSKEAHNFFTSIKSSDKMCEVKKKKHDECNRLEPYGFSDSGESDFEEEFEDDE